LETTLQLVKIFKALIDRTREHMTLWPAKLSRFYHVSLFSRGASHFATVLDVIVSL